MLTRLEVDGFKNLKDVDVRFGPFTCIAGPNGVGKSNLFDAIAFLAALAKLPLVEAAMAVRGGEARATEVRGLFRRVGESTVPKMRFAAEMLIPETGRDSLGQAATASMTFLRYELELGYRDDPGLSGMGALQVLKESMVHINKTSAREHLPFKPGRAWLDSVVKGRRTSPYISTDSENQGTTYISLHADSAHGVGGGRPRRLAALTLPRTVLSSANNAVEHRTLVLAREEMASWTQLQLEPSALRAPDAFTAPRTIAANGAHLPATLHALADRATHPEDLLARVSNRLSQLIDNVRRIHIDVDERRQLRSIVLTDRQGTEHPASALSDGTLRFLALTVMEIDAAGRRLLCLEEPENGMHPARIEAVIALLGDMAVDTDQPVDEDNPLRQVIINTHSPAVVALIDADALLVAVEVRVHEAGNDDAWLSLKPLERTWRGAATGTVSRGSLQAYLNPFGVHEPAPVAGGRQRVIDRNDLQMMLPMGMERRP